METYTYKFPKPSVTTDCIIIKDSKGSKSVLLIKRKYEPFIGKWALPGGFVEIDEDLREGAIRELHEETGLTNIVLNQFCTYGKPGRDPRGRTISVVYFGYVNEGSNAVSAGDDASEVSWFELNDLPPLAFDHEQIIHDFIHQQI